jgi:hypothetical protein
MPTNGAAVFDEFFLAAIGDGMHPEKCVGEVDVNSVKLDWSTPWGDSRSATHVMAPPHRHRHAAISTTSRDVNTHSRIINDKRQYRTTEGSCKYFRDIGRIGFPNRELEVISTIINDVLRGLLPWRINTPPGGIARHAPKHAVAAGWWVCVRPPGRFWHSG